MSETVTTPCDICGGAPDHTHLDRQDFVGPMAQYAAAVLMWSEQDSYFYKDRGQYYPVFSGMHDREGRVSGSLFPHAQSWPDQLLRRFWQSRAAAVQADDAEAADKRRLRDAAQAIWNEMVPGVPDPDRAARARALWEQGAALERASERAWAAHRAAGRAINEWLRAEARHGT